MKPDLNLSAGSYHDLAGLASLRGDARRGDASSLEQVAREFEALFVNMMLDSARKSVIKGGLFESAALDSYNEMFDQQLSVSLSNAGGVGLAETIVSQLEYLQRTASGGSESQANILEDSDNG